MSDMLTIGGKNFSSRLMTGTGKHRNTEDLLAALEGSQCEIITVAIGRLNLEDPNEKTLLDEIDWDKYTILPNTAGSATAEQAVMIARLARQVTGSNWVKVEVIPDPKYLLPDPIGTLEASKILVDDGFTVLGCNGFDFAVFDFEQGCRGVFLYLRAFFSSGSGVRRRRLALGRLPESDADPLSATSLTCLEGKRVCLHALVNQPAQQAMWDSIFELTADARGSAVKRGRRLLYGKHNK